MHLFVYAFQRCEKVLRILLQNIIIKEIEENLEKRNKLEFQVKGHRLKFY
jgi:hypothetical protein